MHKMAGDVEEKRVELLVVQHPELPQEWTWYWLKDSDKSAFGRRPERIKLRDGEILTRDAGRATLVDGTSLVKMGARQHFIAINTMG